MKDSADVRFKDQVVLVTGGSRGIGAAVVRRFAKEKAKVHFTYRASKDAAEKLVRSLEDGSVVRAWPCDVRDAGDVKRVVEGVLEIEQRIDVLVNNAGVIKDGLFLAMRREDWDEVIDTNLGGVYHFCRQVVRTMVMQRQGRIVNISSVVGELGGYGQTNYAASKGAVNAFTKALASELASRNVTVNAVAPGMVNTEMSDAARSAFGEKIKERIPVGSFAEAEEIAAAVAFLASAEARYITGQILTVDGGLSLLSRK